VNRSRTKEDVPRDVQGILKVSFKLAEDIFAGASKEDGAGLGILAVFDESEVFVSYLSHFEEPCSSADVSLGDVLRSVDDGGAAGTGNAEVVRTRKRGARFVVRL
jgi:hypothetical protein